MTERNPRNEDNPARRNEENPTRSNEEDIVGRPMDDEEEFEDVDGDDSDDDDADDLGAEEGE